MGDFVRMQLGHGEDLLNIELDERERQRWDWAPGRKAVPAHPFHSPVSKYELCCSEDNYSEESRP